MEILPGIFPLSSSKTLSEMTRLLKNPGWLNSSIFLKNNSWPR